MISPFLSIPNEILYNIAGRLSLCSTISLLKTCDAMVLPIDAFLLSSYKDDILLFAASKNRLPLLKRALSAGAEINYITRYGCTALYRASENGHAQILTELLSHNPDLEYRGTGDYTPLLCAVHYRHESCADLLLGAGGNPDATAEGQTLLVMAIDANLTRLATRFLHQLDATAVDHAIEHKLYPIAQAMFEYDPTLARSVPTPLHRAVFSGLKYVKLCIDHGADINAPQGPDDDGDPGGYTALGLAAHRGNLAIMHYLLQEGADVDEGEGTAYPIFGAVRRSHLEALKTLLKQGVDVEYYRNETDLLYIACGSGHPVIVQMLLDTFEALGGDWTWVGDTDLLLTAVRKRHIHVVQLLLERGAEVNTLSTHAPETALLCAVKAGSIALVDILLAGGADPRMVVGGKTPLLWVKESEHPVIDKGRMMAVLLRGGADIGELSKRWRKKVQEFIRELDQRMVGE